MLIQNSSVESCKWELSDKCKLIAYLYKVKTIEY